MRGLHRSAKSPRTGAVGLDSWTPRRVQSQAGKDVLANGRRRSARRFPLPARRVRGVEVRGRKTFLDQSLRLLEIPEDCRQTIGLHAPASGARRTLQHRQPQPDGGQVIVHFMKSSRILVLPRRGWLARRSRLREAPHRHALFLDAPAMAVNGIWGGTQVPWWSGTL